jgi:hypothetical protein
MLASLFGCGQRSVRWKFKVVVDGNILIFEGVDMGLQITDAGGAALLAPSVLDAAGNPAGDGPFTFKYAVADATLLKLTDNGDGTGAVAAVGALTPVGAPTQLTVSCTDSLGKVVTGELDVTIVAGEENTVTINAGPAT